VVLGTAFFYLRGEGGKSDTEYRRYEGSDTEYRAKRGHMRKRKWKEKIIKCLLNLGKKAKREPRTPQEIIDRIMWDRLNRIYNRRYE